MSVHICEWVENGQQQTGHATESEALAAAAVQVARGMTCVVWELDDEGAVG